MKNSTNTYKLGVIIPCWNCEAYVGELLNCIIGQSFTDWQVFCVDDLSTDSTPEVLKQYVEKDSRIHYIARHRAPKGAQTCRNIGFDATVGAEYVIYLDGDDIIAPYCFEQRVIYMERHPNIDFASFPMKTYKEDLYEIPCNVYGVKFIEDTLQAELNWSLPLVVVTNIYRRDAMLKYGLRCDEKILSLQDSEFNIHTFCTDIKHAYAEDAKCDYFYRATNNGVSKKIVTPAHIKSHIYLIDRTTQEVSASHGILFDRYLQANVVNFFSVFRKNYSAYLHLLQVPWIIRHPKFWIRIFIYLCIGLHLRSILFKSELRYSRMLMSEWADFMNTTSQNLKYSNP